MPQPKLTLGKICRRNPMISPVAYSRCSRKPLPRQECLDKKWLIGYSNFSAEECGSQPEISALQGKKVL